MPCSRESRRSMAITRNQTFTSGEHFMSDVRNSLPRVPLEAETSWLAGRRSIAASMEADRWLRDHGFDRWGQPVRTHRHGG